MIFSTSTHTDINHKGFISRLPCPIKDYAILARLDRPAGIYLLLFPGLFSLFIANGASFSLRCKYSFLFAIGALVMRSAGCIINDIWDKDIDTKVERTAMRPLACGKISLTQAFIFLIFLLFIGSLILYQLPIACIYLAPIALFLVILYPLAKRFTWWPQLIMGITFGFSSPMGYIAITNNMDLTGWLLYIATIFWQLGFDTVYGFQDMKDDIKIGVKSSSQRVYAYAQFFVTSCYFITISLLTISIFYNHISLISFPLFLIGSSMLLYKGIKVSPNNQQECLNDFNSNIKIGFIFSLSFIIGRYFA